MKRTALLLSIVGCACTSMASSPESLSERNSSPLMALAPQASYPGSVSNAAPTVSKTPSADELAKLWGPQAPTAEELAADELDPAFVAKKDGKLILQQLAAAAAPVIEGATPNYMTYRGMKVGMKLKADQLVVRVSPDTTTEAAVVAASKLGLRIKDSMRTGAGDYVILTLIDPLADINSAGLWVNALAAEAMFTFAAPVFVTPLRGDAICFPTPDLMVRVNPAVLGSGAGAMKLSPLPLALVEDKLGTIEGGARLAITGKNGFDAMRAANVLSELTDFGVVYAECDMMQQFIAYDTIPNDPEFVNQWQHRNTGQFVGWTSGVDMNTPPAWDLTTGAGIRVAVMDVGVQQGHPDINQLTGRDFTTGAASGVGDGGPVNFCEKHGTPCASIIASFFNNGVGGAGVAPNASVISCRIAVQNYAPSSCSNTFTGFSYSWYINALAWSIGQGHRATSNSFGGGGVSQAVDDQITNNYNNGSATFVSTGNDSALSIGYPASSPSAIAIGAMDPSGVIAGFSNRGNGISMVGPGVNLRCSDRTGSDGYTNNDVTFFSGTSAACPAVAGIAALTLSAHPHLSPAGLKFFMQTFCRDFGAFGYDTTYGFGMPNALNIITGFAPNNDECSGAHVISGLSYTESVNTTNATNRANEPHESCGGSTNSNSVYWRYSSTAYGTASINTFTSSYDTVLSVFNGCGLTINLGSGPIFIPPSQLACNDDSGGLQSAVSVPMTPGSDYVVKVAKYGTAYTVGGTANLNFTFTPSAPPNDSRFSATSLLPAGQAVIGTTNYATNDSGTLATCGNSGSSADVWYSMTATCSADYTLSTYSSNFDTVLTVYSGSALFLNYVACNDDCNPPDRNSCVSFHATTGTTYFFRVSGYSGATGVFNLSLSAPTVANDECGGAVAVVPGASGSPSTYAFSNGCATNSTGLTLADCGPFATDIRNDVWYSVTLDADSTVDIDTTGTSFDTVLAVYQGCPAAGAAPIICNDDSGGTLQSALSFAASAGVTYLVRVGSYSATGNGDGVINFAATATVVVPTCLADVNLDGVVDGSDFVAFINSFAVGDVTVDAVADIAGGGAGTIPDPDGTIDGSDFVAFINAFALGC